MTSDPILSVTRPHPRLLTYYIIQSCLLPPLSFLAFPFLYFRYHSMRYRFDDEGISMSWGVLSRHQVNLTYARIQDIHLTSGPIQRWLGLADLHIQTASGSASAEMKIEGLLEYEAVRDFLYSKMRGYRDRTARRTHPGALPAGAPLPPPPGAASGASETELAALLLEIRDELRQVREALQPGARAAEEEESVR